MKYLAWAFWNCYYWVLGRPKTLEGFIRASIRTRHPNWKFEPYVYYNQDGKQWDIWFENEDCYVDSFDNPFIRLKGEAYTGMDSKRVVGLTIYAESMKGEKND